MTRHEAVKRAGAGAVAGLAGTALIQGMQAAGMKKMPEKMPPIKQHPGEYMVKKGEELLPPQVREKVPRGLESSVSQLLGIGYGVTFAALFGLVERMPRRALMEGTILGLVTWGAGYLGWLPATGLMPPVTRQKPVQVAGGIAGHILFGMVTAEAFRVLQSRRHTVAA